VLAPSVTFFAVLVILGFSQSQSSVGFRNSSSPVGGFQVKLSLVLALLNHLRFLLYSIDNVSVKHTF